ncbi:MAG: hypothetical protein FJ387_02295 [Verrucomicrobia bacterium]|nr:hypothetical protein [Verrucomicrobiota bacterium]
MPQDNDHWTEFELEFDLETDATAPMPGDAEPAPPEGPEGLNDHSAEEEEEPETAAKDFETSWEAFLASLPPPTRAILDLYQAHPADFGWMIGRDGQGRLSQLELDLAKPSDWRRVFQALPRSRGAKGRGRGPGLVWPNAAALAADWRQRGPDFWRLVNVDLPNLRDAAPVLAQHFGELRHAGKIAQATLATAELLCARPLAYWWLVFGPAVEDWDGLFATLQSQSIGFAATATVVALRETWNLEGRPVALASV